MKYHIYIFIEKIFKYILKVLEKVLVDYSYTQKINCLLTDFNTELYKNIDIESVIEQFEIIKDKAKSGLIIGEIEATTEYNISLRNVAFAITNLTLSENKIYGDIKFVKNNKGRVGFNLFKNNPNDEKFLMRHLRVKNDNSERSVIKKIFTWDLKTY